MGVLAEVGHLLAFFYSRHFSRAERP